MRPVLVLLLLAVLCADSGALRASSRPRPRPRRALQVFRQDGASLMARALHCHVCCGHANCESLVECAQTDKYCVITRATNPGGILVMKSCAPTCPNSTVSSDGRALSVFCCQGSQCNRNGAGGLAGGRGALWASASGSLLWALLWAAW